MLPLIPTVTDLKSRLPLYGVIFLVGFVGWYAGHISTGPQLVEVATTRFIVKVEEKEVIKYVEVEKERTQHTEITKPDGTKIVTTIQTKEEKKESSKEESKSKTEVAEQSVVKEQQAKDKYYLGLSLDLQNTYSVIGGVRLGDLPLYATGQVAVHPFNKFGVGLGLSYHF